MEHAHSANQLSRWQNLFTEWRMTSQHLMQWSRAAYDMANQATALSNLTPHHTKFTVIDLANAFFCLPFDEWLQSNFKVDSTLILGCHRAFL